MQVIATEQELIEALTNVFNLVCIVDSKTGRNDHYELISLQKSLQGLVIGHIASETFIAVLGNRYALKFRVFACLFPDCSLGHYLAREDNNFALDYEVAFMYKKSKEPIPSTCLFNR